MRLELDPAQMAAALEKREEICSVLKKLGFSYITLDLEDSAPEAWIFYREVAAKEASNDNQTLTDLRGGCRLRENEGCGREAAYFTAVCQPGSQGTGKLL